MKTKPDSLYLFGQDGPGQGRVGVGGAGLAPDGPAPGVLGDWFQWHWGPMCRGVAPTLSQP